MKFVIQSTPSVRRGCLSSFKRLPEVSVETPACMLFTKCGSVPHLSLDVLRKVERLPSIVVMGMSTLSSYHDVVRECPGGLAEFTSTKGKVVFCTSHDVSERLTKFNVTTNKMMVVLNRGGNKLLSPEDFVKIQEAFKCDMVQVLGDHEANDSMVTAPSRMNKAYLRTVEFLSKVLNLSKGSEIEDTPLLASLEGGLLHEPRTRCAKDSAISEDIEGFVLEGFHDRSAESEMFWDKPAHLSVIRDTISCLPNDKVRMTGGALHPLAVIALVREGIDLFDTSYTYQVTQRGGALCFPYSGDPESSALADIMFELDLSDSKYADQFIPLLADCQCHACTNFTRGYINHLLNTKEMLAQVLLSIHNIHHYLRFFERLRQCIDTEELDALEETIRQSRGANVLYKKDSRAPTPNSISQDGES